MAKQVINLGTMADNKSGDPLRTAFTKINENFDELYTSINNAGGSGVNVGDQTTEPSQVSDIVFSGATVENIDGVSTVSITPQNIPDIGDVVFNGVIIRGTVTGQVGHQFTIDTDYQGNTGGINGNGIAVDKNIPNISSVAAGDVIVFAENTSVVVAGSYYASNIDAHVISWNDSIQIQDNIYPLTITSPDYQAGNPTHLVLSSGNTSPGSAIDIKETQIDMNYAGFGTGFSFSPDGLVFPDSSVQTTASTGGGGGGSSYQATLTDINGDWHQGSPNTFSLDDWSYDIINVSQNGAVSNITLTLPSTPAHGKMQTIKYSGVADKTKVCNIIATQNIENLPEQTITISKDNGYVTFVWDNDWATWWIISKDLADSIVGSNTFVDSTITLDLTKTVNKITPVANGGGGGGTQYYLPNGQEGQIMHIVPGTGGEMNSQYTTMSFDSARWSNGNGVINEGSTSWWLPFQNPLGGSSAVLTLVFTDGAWNLPHNWFD